MKVDKNYSPAEILISQRGERNVKYYLDLDSSMENEQAEPTSETSPDQENVNKKSSASSEDVEEAFISRGKGTSSDREPTYWSKAMTKKEKISPVNMNKVKKLFQLQKLGKATSSVLTMNTVLGRILNKGNTFASDETEMSPTDNSAHS
ncbi:hypothetical protein QE152_g24435 [Popillia japonica]|uniref:Uncharacterized protein n=1 Tax=Popillia japonica TaxID=7064 RepID=A0AAW1KC11_POPJA